MGIRDTSKIIVSLLWRYFLREERQNGILAREKAIKAIQDWILNAFIASLEDKETVIDEFSTDLWNLMIQDALVNEDGSIAFIFKNGAKIVH